MLNCTRSIRVPAESSMTTPTAGASESNADQSSLAHLAFNSTGGRNSKLSTAVTVGVLALSTFSGASRAGLINNIANVQAHRNAAGQQLLGGSLATQYGGAAVGLRTINSLGVAQNSTSTTLSGNYILAPRHSIERVLDLSMPNGIAAGASLEISTGPNAQTDRGLVRFVSRIITFSGTAANDPSRPDYCVLELSEALPNVTAIVIAPPTTGALANVTGFGSEAGIGGTPIRTYWAMGGTAPIMSASNLVNYSATYYRPFLFDPSRTPPLNWKGLNGDSGSPWVVPGQGVVAMSVAASNGTGAAGLTVGLVLSEPSVFANLSQFTVPSPSTAVLFGLGGLLAAQRRRQPAI